MTCSCYTVFWIPSYINNTGY